MWRSRFSHMLKQDTQHCMAFFHRAKPNSKHSSASMMSYHNNNNNSHTLPMIIDLSDDNDDDDDDIVDNRNSSKTDFPAHSGNSLFPSSPIAHREDSANSNSDDDDDEVVLVSVESTVETRVASSSSKNVYFYFEDDNNNNIDGCDGSGGGSGGGVDGLLDMDPNLLSSSDNTNRFRIDDENYSRDIGGSGGLSENDAVLDTVRFESFSRDEEEQITVSASKRDEREKRRYMKKKAQEEKERLRGYRKRAAGNHAHEEIVIYLDNGLVSSSGGAVIEADLKTEYPNTNVRDLDVYCGVQWSRRLPRDFSQQFSQHFSSQSSQGEEEPMGILLNTEFEEIPLNYLLVRIQGEMAASLLKEDGLERLLDALVQRHLGKTIVLLIEGLFNILNTMEQMRYRAAMQDGAISSSHRGRGNGKKARVASELAASGLSVQDIEFRLLSLQIRYRCHMYHTKNIEETSRFIRGMTKFIAMEPYRKKPTALDFNNSSSKKRHMVRFWNNVMERRDFDIDNVDSDDDTDCSNNTFNSSDSRNKQSELQRRIRLAETWFRQLMEIPQVSEKMAQGIVYRYPTINSFMERLTNARLTQEEKRNLLKDVKCFDHNIELPRSIGPKISSRIFEFYSKEDDTS